jgi:diguanylate cyclase (GGDEF)-like protein
MRTRVRRFLTQTHPLATAGVLVILISIVDAATGTNLRVFPLYFIPLALVAASQSRTSAVVAAVIGSGFWAVSNYDSQQPLISVSNVFSQFVAFVLVALLVNLQKSRADLQQMLASVDPLTGLANSRAFYESAGTELSRQQRKSHPLTMAYLDVDDFKQVNTTIGHAGADQLLRSVAEAMKLALRGSDYVGRLGGDEFAILLPETTESQALEVLNRVRTRVLAATSDQPKAVTFSIGAVTFIKPAESVETMMRLADAQMYQVKGRCKDDIQVCRADQLALA